MHFSRKIGLLAICALIPTIPGALFAAGVGDSKAGSDKTGIVDDKTGSDKAGANDGSTVTSKLYVDNRLDTKQDKDNTKVYKVGYNGGWANLGTTLDINDQNYVANNTVTAETIVNALSNWDISDHKVNGAPLSNKNSYFYGIGAGTESSAAKAVSIPSITSDPTEGMTIVVTPKATTNTDTLSLSLNGGSKHAVAYDGRAIDSREVARKVWRADVPVAFVYDGTNWQYIGTDTTYTADETTLHLAGSQFSANTAAVEDGGTALTTGGQVYTYAQGKTTDTKYKVGYNGGWELLTNALTLDDTSYLTNTSMNAANGALKLAIDSNKLANAGTNITSLNLNSSAADKDKLTTAWAVNQAIDGAIDDADISDHTVNGAPLSNTASYYYGVSSTATGTAAKTVNITSITADPTAGMMIVVNPGATATTETNLTLNLNSKGAKSIKYNGSTTITADDAQKIWRAGVPVVFVYDGTNWVFTAYGADVDTDTTYTALTQADITDGNGETGHLISAKLLRDNFYTETETDTLLNAKEDKDNKVKQGNTSGSIFTDSSTDDEYPSAKAVYTALEAQSTDISNKQDKDNNQIYKVGYNGGWAELGTTLDTTANGYVADNAVTAGTIATALGDKQDKDNNQVYKVGYNGGWTNLSSAVSVDTTYLKNSNSSNSNKSVKVAIDTSKLASSAESITNLTANSSDENKGKLTTAYAVKLAIGDSEGDLLKTHAVNAARLGNNNSIYWGVGYGEPEDSLKLVTIGSMSEELIDDGVFVIITPKKTAKKASMKLSVNDVVGNIVYNGSNSYNEIIAGRIWREGVPSIFVFDKNNGTWVYVGAEYDNFAPATVDNDGVHGLVPAPARGMDERLFLNAMGSWDIPVGTTYDSMSVNEGTTGTSPIQRTLTAQNLKQIIQGTTLTGINTTTTGAVSAADTVLGGIGKLQASKQDKDNTTTYKVGYNGGWAALGTTLDTTDQNYVATNAVTAGTIASALGDKQDKDNTTTYKVGYNGGWAALGTTLDTTDQNYVATNAVTAETIVNALSDSDISDHTVNGAPLSNAASYFFATSNTAGDEPIKDVTIPSITAAPTAGMTIIVSPTITTTANSLKINLNGTGAMGVLFNGASITSSDVAKKIWSPGRPSVFVCTGSRWAFVGHRYDGDNTTIQLDSHDYYTFSAKTAAVADGGTALATGDQIYDFVTNQGYITSADIPTALSAFTDDIDAANVLNSVKLDGTALSVDSNKAVDIPLMGQATSSAGGAIGLVPTSSAGDQAKVLTAGRTWAVNSTTTVTNSDGSTVATSSSANDGSIKVTKDGTTTYPVVRGWSNKQNKPNKSGEMTPADGKVLTYTGNSLDTDVAARYIQVPVANSAPNGGSATVSTLADIWVE